MKVGQENTSIKVGIQNAKQGRMKRKEKIKAKKVGSEKGQMEYQEAKGIRKEKQWSGQKDRIEEREPR